MQSAVCIKTDRRYHLGPSPVPTSVAFYSCCLNLSQQDVGHFCIETRSPSICLPLRYNDVGCCSNREATTACRKLVRDALRTSIAFLQFPGQESIILTGVTGYLRWHSTRLPLKKAHIVNQLIQVMLGCLSEPCNQTLRWLHQTHKHYTNRPIWRTLAREHRSPSCAPTVLVPAEVPFGSGVPD